MFAQDSRVRPPTVVDDTSSRIYFSPPGSSGSGGGFLSFVFSMCYNVVTSILQLVFAIFRTNVRPGKTFFQLTYLSYSLDNSRTLKNKINFLLSVLINYL